MCGGGSELDWRCVARGLIPMREHWFVALAIHSRPVPLWAALSLALSACARRWAQFWIGVAAWGMGARNKSLAIKKIHPDRYNGQN